MVPLWYVAEGTPHPAQAAEPPASGLELVGWTYAKSQKAKNLERDPRATLGIEDGVQYHELRGVMLECDVEMERDAASVEGYGLKLFARYAGELGEEVREMVAKQAPKRIGLRFVPSRVVSWDHRKLGGAY
jgi:hypothetical protein